jgi:hypothetical protein
MISRRNSAFLRVALPLFGLALASCDRATDSTQPALHSGTATFDRKPVPKGVISARVLTNKAGVSILEVRTGTFDNATNTGVPDGWFEKIEYTITQNDPGKKPKKIFDRTVTFERSNPTLFSEVINVCQTDENDSGEGDGHGYDGHGNTDKKPLPLCPLQTGKSYSIAIEADLEGVGGVEWNDAEVRDTAIFYNNPEIDLSAEKVQIVLPTGQPADQLLAKVDSATTYQVRFTNGSATIGIRTTCEVHVFNSNGSEVTLAGRTYRWVPNGRAAYDATKARSVASDTTTIKPGEQAICQFTMTLGPTGSYRIVVTANAVYPDDYDPTNNNATGTVTVIADTPIFPPPGGFSVYANALDYALYGDTATVNGVFTYSNYRGDSAQSATIDSLTSTIVTGNGLTGTYSLGLSFYTVDSVVNRPATATRPLAMATWTGDLARLANLASQTSGGFVGCDSSSASGSLSAPVTANGNKVSLVICLAQISAVNYKFTVGARWTAPAAPPLPVPASLGVSYGDFLYFDVSLKLPTLGVTTTSHAPVDLSCTLVPASAFGAKISVQCSH